MSMKDSCGICSTLMQKDPEVTVAGGKDSMSANSDLMDDGVISIKAAEPADGAAEDTNGAAADGVGTTSTVLDSIVEEGKTDKEEEEEEEEPQDASKTASAEEERTDAEVDVEVKEVAVDVPDASAPAPDPPAAVDVETEEEKKEEEVATSKAPAPPVATSPVNEITVVKEVSERDFDKNPTDLYLSLMRKDWTAAMQRCHDHPDETETWIYRKETSGKLRWKLLPIHASIIFAAPVPVIQALLNANSKTAAFKDDQGMVPLHLAMRMGSDQAVIEALVSAQPEAVTAKDRKGRTPRHLAQKHHAKPSVLAILDSGTATSSTGSPPSAAAAAPVPGIAASISKAIGVAVSTVTTPKAKGKAYAVSSNAGMSSAPVVVVRKAAPAPVMVERSMTPSTPAPLSAKAAAAAAVEAERKVHMDEVDKIHTAHAHIIATMKKDHSDILEKKNSEHTKQVAMLVEDAEAKLTNFAGRIEILEQTIALDKSTNEAMEAELKTLKESESELQAKIADLESNVVEVNKEKETSDHANKAVITNLVSQVGDLQGKLTSATADKELLMGEKSEFEDFSQTEMAKLKLKVCDLEAKLGQVTTQKDETTKRMKLAEGVCADQKIKIAALEEKSEEVSKTLLETETKLEEITMSEQQLAWENHGLSEKLEAAGPDAHLNKSKIASLETEREELRDTVNKLSVKLYKVVGFLDEMVQEQEQIISETLTRDSEMGDCKAEFTAEETSEERQKLLDNVTGMKEQIAGVIDSVIDGMPKTDVDDEEEAVGGEVATTPEAVAATPVEP